MQFNDKDKQCFKYFNGETSLYGDPLALQRRLTMACKCDPNELWEQTQEGVPLDQRWLAQEKMCKAVREAFGMVPFDPLTGTGARDEHCLAAWNEFWSWMGEKKNQPASSPTSQPSTASNLSFGNRSTTKPMSASR